MKYLAVILIAFTQVAMAHTPPPPEVEAIPVVLLSAAKIALHSASMTKV
ncbi:MAG TPA: hypothetical protein VGE05_06145 [Novosphingobium sp.]